MRCCAAGDLTQLQLLCVNGCLLRSLPASLARLQRLEMLHMKGVPWIDAENVNIFTRDDFLDFVAKKRLQPYFKHIKQVELSFVAYFASYMYSVKHACTIWCRLILKPSPKKLYLNTSRLRSVNTSQNSRFCCCMSYIYAICSLFFVQSPAAVFDALLADSSESYLSSAPVASRVRDDGLQKLNATLYRLFPRLGRVGECIYHTLGE